MRDSNAVVPDLASPMTVALPLFDGAVCRCLHNAGSPCDVARALPAVYGDAGVQLCHGGPAPHSVPAGPGVHATA